MDTHPDHERSIDLYYKAKELLASGDTSQAIACLKDSWAIAPHANTAFTLGTSLHSLSEIAQAHEWIAMAYQLNPRNSMIATAHARSLLEQGQTPQARDLLRTILNHTPTYGPAKQLLEALQP